MEQYLIQILQIIIGAVIAYLAPIVKKGIEAIITKLLNDMDEKKKTEIEDYILKVVKTVYQKYFTLGNADKFAKALSLVEEKYGKVILTEEQLEVLIESAYLDLKKELGTLNQDPVIAPEPTPAPQPSNDVQPTK